MTFVVGDIHGEITKLQNLIQNIIMIDNNPKFIFVGDYINKGENSKKVLELLSTLSDSIFLIGNHEYYYLKYIQNKSEKNKLIKYGLKTTFKDFDMNLNNIYDKLYIPYKKFFNNLIPFYETEKYFISHAGIDINDIEKDTNEVDIESFTVNNRYEFLNAKKFIKNKKFIFGHTGFSHPYVDEFKIGIDTAAVYSKENSLTAFCIDDEFFLDNFNQKRYLSEYNKNICPIIIRKKPYRMERK